MTADSGNGYHLLYKVKAELESKEIIANFLTVLDMWFSTEEVLIDTAVFNPSRITKLYETVARKGTNSPERPHRQSHFLHVPDEIQATPMALVRQVASEVEKLVPAKQSYTGRNQTQEFDMDRNR